MCEINGFISNLNENFTSIEDLSWNEYQLEDGTTLKLLLVLRGVKRLNKFEPRGTPTYVSKSINVVKAINVPKELKAQPKKPEVSPI